MELWDSINKRENINGVTDIFALGKKTRDAKKIYR
jgi:hypothetical protein